MAKEHSNLSYKDQRIQPLSLYQYTKSCTLHRFDKFTPTLQIVNSNIVNKEITKISSVQD